jgi:hypothetical protein
LAGRASALPSINQRLDEEELNMSENKNVMIVVGGGAEPGGFTMRNMGPDKVVVESGKPFPEAWINPTTLAKLVEDNHMVRTDDNSAYGNEVVEEAEVVEDATEEVPAPDAEVVKEEVPAPAPVFTDEMRNEHCVFEKSDIDEMSRGELDELVAGIYAQVDVEAPKFANMPLIIEFLTSGAE